MHVLILLIAIYLFLRFFFVDNKHTRRNMSHQLRNVISNNGLKIKLYIIDCPRHPTMDHFVKNPKYDQDELSENLKDSKFLPYDLCRQKSDKIFYELENNLFIGYSCLVIILNMICEDRRNILTIVFQCLNANKHLRYKSKLILSMFTPESKSGVGKDRELAFRKTLKTRPKEIKPSIFLYPHKYAKLPRRITRASEYTPKNTNEELQYIFPENTIYIRTFIKKGCDMAIEMESVLRQTYDTPLTPMQIIVVKNAEIAKSVRLITASSTTEFYFYSINPALGIIINQYHFTSHQNNREGSNQDVLRLVRELKVAAIPYILIENCNKQQLLEILKYFSRKDFWPLKKFLFFMMSHGDSAGNIYTTDDKVHIMNDIVKAIQNNESLKTCTQLFCMVSCRGKCNAAYADFDDFDAIMPIDNSSLNDSTTVLYSVPDQMKSPRSTQHGTPLIASLCKHFRTIYHNDCLKQLINDINKTLKDTIYYRCFPNNAIEFVCKDTAANQSIRPVPIDATNMIRLLQSIAKEMKTFVGCVDDDSSVMIKSTFYISGNLCKNQMKLNPWEHKYFSPQLNNDDCSGLVKDFETMSIAELTDYINNEFFKRNA